MRLVFLYGPPAAGKLTVARELAERTGYKLLHNHQTFDLLEPVFGAYHPDFAPLLNRLRAEIVATAAQSGHDGMIMTHVYGPGEGAFVDGLRARVEASGGALHPVRLLPSLAELERRVQHQDRHQFLKLRTPEQLRELMDNWDVLQTVAGGSTLTIDNTNLPPEQAAEQIMRELKLPRRPPEPDASRS